MPTSINPFQARIPKKQQTQKDAFSCNQTNKDLTINLGAYLV